MVSPCHQLTDPQSHKITWSSWSSLIAFRLIPLPSLLMAFETMELLFNHVFRYFGIPKDIISGQGSQFLSHLWAIFMNKLGVSVSLLSRYHPQSNGQVERANQEIRCFLWLFCSENQRDWAQFLPWAKYAHNSLQHSAAQLMSFQCILDCQPPLFSGITPPPTCLQWMIGTSAVSRYGRKSTNT